MDILFESNLGYVECDVCGSGYNTIIVYYDYYAPADTPFRFHRQSRCYGNLDVKNLSRDELVSQMHASKFLLATRYARRNWIPFMRDLERGKYDKGLQNVEALRITPTGVAPVADDMVAATNSLTWMGMTDPVALQDELRSYVPAPIRTLAEMNLEPEPYRCMDSCCNPDHPEYHP